VVPRDLCERPGDRRSDQRRDRSTLRERAHGTPSAGGPDPGQPSPQHERAPAALIGDERDPLLFCFDPAREAIFLVAGDKNGNWDRWYQQAVPLAGERFTEHLIALKEQERR
jgi:Phage derived protein Gp49-like (DUF891)